MTRVVAPGAAKLSSRAPSASSVSASSRVIRICGQRDCAALAGRPGGKSKQRRVVNGLAELAVLLEAGAGHLQEEGHDGNAQDRAGALAQKRHIRYLPYFCHNHVSYPGLLWSADKFH